MSQYKAGDKVWVHLKAEIGTHKYPGTIFAEHRKSLVPTYLIECLIDGDEKIVQTDEENLEPRTNTINSLDAKYAEKFSDPTEAIVAAMATEPTARPEPFQTLITDESKHIKADLDLAIQILERSNASNGYEELGNYARKAIAAALPLLQHISDTFDNLA